MSQSPTKYSSSESRYDGTNIFAQILRGECPCAKLYEDEDSFAFLDVMPQIRGHSLVICKAPATDLLDIDAASLAAVMATVRKLAPVIMRAFDASGFVVRQFNGAAAGQTVFHFHVHILPRHEGDKLAQHAAIKIDNAILQADAMRIRQLLDES